MKPLGVLWRRDGFATVAVGAAVALGSWFVSFEPPAPNLDPSWGAGLYMGTERGIAFGSDIVFTYGPLGFLSSASGWFGDLQAIAFLWLAATYLTLACGLVWALRRTFGALAAALIAFLALALAGPQIEVGLALAAICCFAVLRPEPPPRALAVVIVGGSLLAAVGVLVKLSVGPPILLACAVALIGARARPWQVALFGGLFAFELVALWLATGGSLADLGDYAANGAQIVSGYSEAMGVGASSDDFHGAGLVAELLLLGGLLAAAATASYRDRATRWGGIGVALVLGFSLFKEGVVLADPSHAGRYLATTVVLLAALPWPGARRLPAAAAIVGLALFVAGVDERFRPGPVIARLDPTANVAGAIGTGAELFDPARRAGEAEGARALMVAGYGLDPEMLKELRGRSVAIDPWEIAAAWAYELDWDPLPVFQNYSAYTSALDRLNADRIGSPRGPERILRLNPPAILPYYGSRGFDERWPGWDPPAQALATMCNFEPLSTTSVWQLLGRVPDRCGEPELVASVDSAYGERVEVPAPGAGAVVVTRIHGAEVSGLESLRTLLYRARFRFIEVNGRRTYRLVPGTAGDGLLLAGSPRVTGRGPFAQAPQARTLELTGADGDLRYDFYSMSVEDTPVAADEVRRG